MRPFFMDKKKSDKEDSIVPKGQTMKFTEGGGTKSA